MPTTFPEAHYQEILKRNFNKVHYKSKSCFIAIEEETQDNKRADVFFAFKRGTYGIYISVIEVKTRKTLTALKPQNNELKKLYFAIAAAAILIITVFFIFNIKLLVDFYLLIASFAFVSLLVAAIAYYLKRSKSKLPLSIPAITQLKKYPANEKWIAIAADTFDKKNDFDTLKTYCKKDRIGLIVVHPKGTIKIILKPEPTEENNQYLQKYKRANKISTYLKSKKKYKTPAEKIKTGKQMMIAIGCFSMISIGVLLHGHSSEKSGNAQPLMNTAEFSISDMDKPIQLNVSPEVEKVKIATKSEDCSDLQLTKPHFLVIETICNTEIAAIQRTEDLKSMGLSKCKYIKSDCLNADIPNQQYVVYISRFYNRLSKAEAKLGDLMNFFSKRKKVCQVCEILELEVN